MTHFKWVCFFERAPLALVKDGHKHHHVCLGSSCDTPTWILTQPVPWLVRISPGWFWPVCIQVDSWAFGPQQGQQKGPVVSFRRGKNKKKKRLLPAQQMARQPSAFKVHRFALCGWHSKEPSISQLDVGTAFAYSYMAVRHCPHRR